MNKTYDCSFCENDEIILAKNFDNTIEDYENYLKNILEHQNNLIHEIQKLKIEINVKDLYIKSIINTLNRKITKIT